SIAGGQFPVLIFSPGIYSNASAYYAVIEEVVSHGYIVLNINHTYESTGSLFPDGSIKYFDLEYDKRTNNQDMADMAWRAMEGYRNADDEDQKYAVSEDILRKYIAADITIRWSKDISSVIDELLSGTLFSFLSEHMDASKVGVFGHSQGGSAAGQATLDDDRIKAGMNIDGVQWGNMIDTILGKPFCVVSADWESSHPNFNKYAYRNRSTSDFYSVKILGTGHSNFMDIPLMIKLSAINEAGTINPKLGYTITTETILSFFGKHLLENDIDLFELEEKFPQFKLE
ncbi:MAG: dienelactone hydrolase, partial [Saprospiraceae bacterium]